MPELPPAHSDWTPLISGHLLRRAHIPHLPRLTMEFQAKAILMKRQNHRPTILVCELRDARQVNRVYEWNRMDCNNCELR